MTSKIAADKPGSFALLNGDEAVARGAVEATVKVAASYPGTPATDRQTACTGPQVPRQK